MIYRDQVGLLNLSLKCHIWDKLLFNSAIGSCHCSEMLVSTVQFLFASVKAVCFELLLYCKAVVCVPQQNSTKVQLHMSCSGFPPLGLAAQQCSITYRVQGRPGLSL